MIKLTRRQEEFIKKTIELGNEIDGPIHYSQLAERLGVSPFTAYDMLRVLEKKGFVTSEYQLAADKSGPGRAERLFYPTTLAKQRQRIMAQSAKAALSLEGDGLMQFLLQKIKAGEMPHVDTNMEILARIPPIDQGQVSYCLEVITVMMLNLRQHTKYQVFTRYLPRILPDEADADSINLCLLGGFALGILAEDDSDDPEWSEILFEHVHRYNEIVITLDESDCQRLAAHLMTLFNNLNGRTPIDGPKSDQTG